MQEAKRTHHGRIGTILNARMWRDDIQPYTITIPLRELVCYEKTLRKFELNVETDNILKKLDCTWFLLESCGVSFQARINK